MNKNTWAQKEKIKTLAIRMVRAAIRGLYIFPLRQKRVLFFSFDGKQYSCNPRAISEYLMREYPGEFEIWWAFKNPEQYAFLEAQGIHTVPFGSLKRVFLQASAKYVVNNCGAYSWNPVRKGQFHVNTWHAGGAYKRLQHDAGADYNRRLTAKETTHMISSCRKFTETNILEQFGFAGKVLEIGMPRNDVFFHPEEAAARGAEVRKQYGVAPETLLILFAPTWRYDGVIPEPDYEGLRAWAREKWGRPAEIMVRSHTLSRKEYPGLKDVTAYGDMQDLLCAADVLITDYSSSIWDFSFTGKPCFLFVPDLERYTAEQGFYTDIHTWGFPVCRGNGELKKAILDFDAETFRAAMEEHHRSFGSYEQGTAACRFCEAIFGLKKGEDPA